MRDVKTLFLKHGLAWALVAAAAATFATHAWLRPDAGLVRQAFSDASFLTLTGVGQVDQRIYFRDKLHPVPGWVGQNAAVRWEGFLNAPRAGEYVLKLTSDDGAWLWLDGKKLLDNGGTHPPQAVQRSVFLEKGSHALRVDYVQDGGGAFLRLEWRLPSGYNPAGLIPVSNLHPQSPIKSGLGYRAVAVLPWLFLAAAVVAFRRRSLSRLRQRARRDSVFARTLLAAGAVVTLALAARFIDLNGAGETCDEWAYVGGGKAYAANVFAGVFDPDQWRVNREHPAVGKLIYGFVQEAFGDAQTTTRAASAVMGALTVLVGFALTLRLFGLGPAVAGGVILSLLPPFLAHGKVAALDSPATLFQAVAIWLFIRAVHEPALRTRSLWWLVLVAGLAVATKLTNALVVIYVLGAWFLLYGRKFWRTRTVALPLPVFFLPVLAVVPFFATWPWLWGATVEHLNETLNHWKYTPPELFLGRMMHPPPATYFSAAFLAATPAVLFAPFVLGISQTFRRDLSTVVLRPADADTSHRALLLLLVGWFCCRSRGRSRIFARTASATCSRHTFRSRRCAGWACGCLPDGSRRSAATSQRERASL